MLSPIIRKMMEILNDKKVKLTVIFKSKNNQKFLDIVVNDELVYSQDFSHAENLTKKALCYQFDKIFECIKLAHEKFNIEFLSNKIADELYCYFVEHKIGIFELGVHLKQNYDWSFRWQFLNRFSKDSYSTLIKLYENDLLTFGSLLHQDSKANNMEAIYEKIYLQILQNNPLAEPSEIATLTHKHLITYFTLR